MRNDSLGNHYALTVLTPIAPGEEPALRSYLEGLDQDESPFARLPRTHFGRWVIVPNFVPDPSERRPDDLGIPYLLFSVTIDGDPHSYLDELSVELAPEAERIWRACSGAPDPASGRALKAYLLHNQIHTGLFFSAHPDATVTDVRDSLRERDRAVAFGIRAQGMDPASLQQAFRQEFGV